MDATVSKVSKAAEQGLKTASKAAVGSLKSAKAAKYVLPISTKPPASAGKHGSPQSGMQAASRASPDRGSRPRSSSPQPSKRKNQSSLPETGSNPRGHPTSKSAKPAAKDASTNRPASAEATIRAGNALQPSGATYGRSHASLSPQQGITPDDRTGSCMPLLVAGCSGSNFPIRPTVSSVAANIGSMYGDDWQLGTSLRGTPRDEWQRDEAGRREWRPPIATPLCIVLLLFGNVTRLLPIIVSPCGQIQR